MNNYVYNIGNKLYINLTNRCSNNCDFCIRHDHNGMNNIPLWIDEEPTPEDVICQLPENMDEYDKEVVFCGFGEPTERFDDLLTIAAFVKEQYQKPIRINTNGQGNLINKRDIVPEMKGLVDAISISLNTPNEDRYHELVRSRFGDQAFQAMLDFAKEAKEYVPQVILSTVETTITKEEEKECQKICDDLGVTYRIREFEEN